MRGRQPVLGLEGTAADPLEWVLEGRLARTDRTSRGAPQNPHWLAPWTSSDPLGRLSTSYFCVKETWLDPGSVFPGRPMCPDRLPLSASPSIHSVPKPSRTWSAPADPPRGRPGLHPHKCGALWARSKGPGDRHTRAHTLTRTESPLVQSVKYSDGGGRKVLWERQGWETSCVCRGSRKASQRR